jgi:hypothetical protein
VLEERKRRVGENEAVFREVNEMVRPVEPTWMRILCECGDRACRDHVVVAQDEYSRVREDARLFLIRPGHESVETESVISKNLEYWIVRKLPGLPAEIARATDPNGA